MYAIILAVGCLPGFGERDSPIRGPFDSIGEAPEVAARRGTATAAADLEAGTRRILYYGRPWSLGEPLVDGATGFRVQIVEGCCVTAAFAAEVDAYNAAMRASHASRREGEP